MLSRGETLGSMGRGVIGPAAAAAGVTDVDCPVVDMTGRTGEGGFDNLALFLGIGAVTAGAKLRIEVYTCDDAAGTNPVLVTSSDDVVPVANQGFQADVVGVPGYFVKLRVKRLTQNTAVTGGWQVLYGNRSRGLSADPHVTIPWN